MSLMICWVIFFSIFTDLADGCGVTPAFASMAEVGSASASGAASSVGVIVNDTSPLGWAAE